MTPPTYSPWWKPFEWLASPGFGDAAAARAPIGDPALDHDCRQGQDWRRHLTPRALFAAWSPPDASPWSGYARPTLFAAVHAGPDVHPGATGPSAADVPSRAHIPAQTAVVLDLPGNVSVAYAAWLARAGMQPVVMANNWPHSKGVVPMGNVLGALLYWVPWVMPEGPGDRAPDLQGRFPPPAFVLDRDRLGVHLPRMGDFDNRYFHVDADFPSAATLRRNGVERILYIRPDVADPPRDARGSQLSPWDRSSVPNGPEAASLQAGLPPAQAATAPELDDLNAWLVACGKSMGIDVAYASAARWALSAPEPYMPRPRKTVFSTVSDPAFAGFRRASVGGFGRLIPESTSGGAYGGFG